MAGLSQQDSCRDGEKNADSARSTTPEFWIGYRVERVGGTVYISDDEGDVAQVLTVDQARAFGQAILKEVNDE